MTKFAWLGNQEKRKLLQPINPCLLPVFQSSATTGSGMLHLCNSKYQSLLQNKMPSISLFFLFQIFFASLGVFYRFRPEILRISAISFPAWDSNWGYYYSGFPMIKITMIHQVHYVLSVEMHMHEMLHRECRSSISFAFVSGCVLC